MPLQRCTTGYEAASEIESALSQRSRGRNTDGHRVNFVRGGQEGRKEDDQWNVLAELVAYFEDGFYLQHYGF